MCIKNLLTFVAILKYELSLFKTLDLSIIFQPCDYICIFVNM